LACVLLYGSGSPTNRTPRTRSTGGQFARTFIRFGCRFTLMLMLL
jgi:hypothetical protein